VRQAGKRAPRLRRSREDIRERLLESALAEFGAKGFDGASTRVIAEGADAHQPQIHYHFESKEALWSAAVDHLFAELRGSMDGLDLDVSRPPGVLADAFAEMIRRFVRFASVHPELNQIVVHEATAQSERLRWMTERHVRPVYDGVRALWHRLREAGIAAPIDDAVFHYVLVGAASLPYVNAPEARLLTGAEPTAPAWVERHADGLVATFLPNRAGSASQP
jgi:TetR/AcrR family transcriptional regulator